jgi:uncharacterized protein YlxW (UPF0749 family)
VKKLFSLRPIVALFFVALATLAACQSKSPMERLQRQNDSLQIVLSQTSQLLYNCQNAENLNTQKKLEKLLNQLENEAATTTPMPARPR